MVSFETVNVDSIFYLSNTRDKTKNILLWNCFLKEVDRIMQNSSERLYFSFLWKTAALYDSECHRRKIIKKTEEAFKKVTVDKISFEYYFLNKLLLTYFNVSKLKRSSPEILRGTDGKVSF